MPAYGLYVASFVFGVCVWVYGFMVTYEIWGGVGVLIGLMLGIVGIVPLGIIAALWHSEWVIAAELTYGVVLTYGARAIALWLRAGFGPPLPAARKQGARPPSRIVYTWV